MNIGVGFYASVQLLALGVGVVILITHLQGWWRGIDRRVNRWAALLAWMACLAVCAYLWESVAPADAPLWSRKLGLLCAMGMGVVGLGVAAAIVHRPVPRPWFWTVTALWGIEAVLLFSTSLIVRSTESWTMVNGTAVVRLENGPIAHVLQIAVVVVVLGGLWKLLPYSDPVERRILAVVPIAVVFALVNDELLAAHVIQVGMPLLSLAYILCAVAVFSLVQHRYRRALDHLGDEVAARTAEVNARNRELTTTNVRLQDALDAARAGARAKSFFVENMSHELRTPLTGILGVVEVLDDDRLTDEQRDILAQLRASGEDLLQTLTGIVDENRIAAGAFEVAEVEFDLIDTIEAAVESYAAPAVRKDVTLFSLCHPSLPRTVRGDPVRLRQIVSQLVDNAVKFTSEGHVKVEAWPVEADATTMELAIEVVDTGCGIEPARREAIFEAFTQGDSSSTKQHRGIGLGLTLARQVVELLGGEMTLDSSPGLGSRFRVTLPFAVVDDRPWNVDGFDDLKLLIIAAEPAARECLRTEMIWVGAEVRDVAMFGAALDALDNFGPDSVVLDSSTPVEVGDRLSDVLRARRGMGATGPSVIVVAPAGLPTAQTVPASWLRDAVITRPGRSAEMRLLREQFLRRREEGTFPAGPGDVDVTEGVDDNLPVPVAAQLGGRPAASEVAAGLAAGAGAEPHAHRATVRTVLIVEDHPVNQRVLSAIVRRLGGVPVVCDDGAQAVEAVKRQGASFDVILMDCQMPVLDGYDATVEIRAWEETSGLGRIPIIAVTANALGGDREKCLAAGMDDYLTKPVRPEDLRATIERQLARLHGATGLPGAHAGRPALPAANRALPPARSAGGAIPPAATGAPRLPLRSLPVGRGDVSPPPAAPPAGPQPAGD